MSYIGRNIDSIDNIATLDNLSFNGSLQTFNLTQNSVAFVPVSADALQIQIDGVIQSGNYTCSGSQVTFDFVPSGSSVCNGIRHYGVGLLTTVSDSSITTAKLGNSAVTDAKISAMASSKLTGVVPTANLGSGTASSSTVLFGDQTFKTAPSGAMTLIARNSGSSQIGNIGLDNVFSDTYDYYKIYMWVNAVASGGDLYWRFRKNGSDRTDSHYRGVSTLSQVTSSAESVSSSMQIWSNTFFQLFNNANSNANMGDALDITVFDPRARDEGMIATLQASITQYRADNVFRNFRWSGQYGNQGSGDDFDGFKIYYTNSDIRYYDYAIYGMNKT